MVGADWRTITLDGRTAAHRERHALDGCALIFTAGQYDTGCLIDGVRWLDAFDPVQFGNNTFQFTTPPLYDPQRRLIPFRQVLTFDLSRPTTASLAQLMPPPEMISTTHHAQLRFVPLANLGFTTPANLYVSGAAVFVRMNNYNPGAACVDGLNIFQNLRSVLPFGVVIDWPPLYDQDWNLIPYQHTFKFSAQGGQPIEGCVTIIDVIPN